VNVDATATLVDGGPIALVAGAAANPAAVPRRARLRNRLDGPVLPPRSGGVPERPWDDDGATVVVPAGDRRPFGYACPLPPGTEATDLADPPVALVETERAPETAGDGDAADSGDGATDADDAPEASVPSIPGDTAAAAVRELGRPEPPRDAVSGAATTAEHDADAVRDEPSGGGDPPGDDGRGCGSGAPLEEGANCGSGVAPEATAEWLDRVAGRVAVAEALEEPSLAAAPAAVAAAGGIEGVRSLPAALDGDAAALRAVAERAAALARRAEAAAPSVAAIESLVEGER